MEHWGVYGGGFWELRGYGGCLRGGKFWEVLGGGYWYNWEVWRRGVTDSIEVIGAGGRWYHCESDMAHIYKWRVSWNYVYSSCNISCETYYMIDFINDEILIIVSVERAHTQLIYVIRECMEQCSRCIV